MAQFQPIEKSEDFEDELEVDAYERNYEVRKSLWQEHCRWLGPMLVIISSLAIASVILITKETTTSVKNRLNVPTASETLEGDLPYLMYGTAWKEDSTSDLVEDAVMNGFRFIDTANQPKHYNEEGVGAGWMTAANKLGLERKDFYLQTKFTPLSGQDPNNVPYDKTSSLSEMLFESAKRSLQNLQTDYIDALILHSPYETMEDTLTVWRAMESLVDDGSVLRIGISNCYNYDTLTDLYNNARIKPAILQDHLITTTFEPRFLQFTRDYNMEYQAFWTLSSRNHLNKSEIVEMASRKGLSPQLYMYAFLLALDITPLDGGKTHQSEDIEFILKLQNGSLKLFETEEEFVQMADALDMTLP